MTAISFVVCCSFVSHVPIQVTCKQGNSFTSHTTLPTTQWHTRCKPLCLHERFARTTKWEPNRRPYTTERPLSLKTMRAEPPSLYDGTSTFTQIAKHNTRNCSSTCSLFVNTVHHTRTIAYVPNRAKCSLRSQWTLNR